MIPLGLDVCMGVCDLSFRVELKNQAKEGARQIKTYAA